MQKKLGLYEDVFIVSYQTKGIIVAINKDKNLVLVQLYNNEGTLIKQSFHTSDVLTKEEYITYQIRQNKIIDFLKDSDID